MATPGNTAVLGLKVVKRQLDKALKAFDEREHKINSQKSSLQSKINREMNSLIHLIEDRKKQLLAQLDSTTEQKRQTLSAHKRQVERSRERMNSILLEASTQPDREKQEITVEFDPHSIQPQIEADILFLKEGVEQLRRGCKTFGSIYSEQAAVDSCSANGKELSIAVSGTVSTVKVEKVSENLTLESEIVSAQTGTTVKCDISQENGHHKISYQPVGRGRHNLHIRGNGRHIPGSPFPVTVLPSPESLRNPVRVVEGLEKPRGVATNSKGDLIVIEYQTNAVTIITRDGERRSFGGFGTEKGKFNKPRGVAVDKDNNIYVSDSGNHRVQKFNANGRFLAAVGTFGSDDGQFNLPLGISFNKKKDHLYVCDQANFRVQVFSTNLVFKQSFGSEGSEQGEFNFPESIAIDGSNNVYITDYYNNRVQVFTADGQFLRSITHKSPTGESKSPAHPPSGHSLTHPRAVTVDEESVVYVSEWERDAVCVFAPQGEFVELLGNDDKPVDRVCGLTLDSDNSVIVSRHNRLEIL